MNALMLAVVFSAALAGAAPASSATPQHALLPDGVRAMASDATPGGTVVAGSERGLFISRDGGSTFVAVDNTPGSLGGAARPAAMPTVLAVSEQVFVAVDDYGRVFRSADGGSTWVPSWTGLPVPLERRTGPVRLAMGREGGAIYGLLQYPVHSERVETYVVRSVDGGAGWVVLKALPRDDRYLSIRVASEGAVPVVDIVGKSRTVHLRDRAPRDLKPVAFGAEPNIPPRRLTAEGLPSIPADYDYRSGTGAPVIAVLYDDGTLVAINDIENAIDPGLTTLVFKPNPAVAGAYDVRLSDSAPPVTSTGTNLNIMDEDVVSHALPFDFPYFGSSYGPGAPAAENKVVWVSDNGNLGFGPAADPTNADFRIDTFETEAQLAGYIHPWDVNRNFMSPPRIAVMWDDFDSGLGQVLWDESTAGQVSVTWFAVPQWELGTDTNTFRATLYDDGTIELSWEALALRDGLTGISPGMQPGPAPALLNYSNFSHDTPFTAPSNQATYEWFNNEFFTDRVAKEFYRCHGDVYDQILMWGASDYPYPVAGEELALAFVDLVKNDVLGVGIDTQFDHTWDYGAGIPPWRSPTPTPGLLGSAIVMGKLADYPTDPQQDFQTDANTLDIIGQQTGRQYAAYVWFDDAGTPSQELLGRVDSHWNFYLDTDASDMEGNDWLEGSFVALCDDPTNPANCTSALFCDDGMDTTNCTAGPPVKLCDDPSVATNCTTPPFCDNPADLTNCSGAELRWFDTVQSDERYSELDLYLMGLLDATSVADFSLVTDVVLPGDCSGLIDSCRRYSAPEPGIRAVGTPKMITMTDIQNFEGPRDPVTEPTDVRQAWALVIPPGGATPPLSDLSKLDTFREAWSTAPIDYYALATGGRGTVNTVLEDPGTRKTPIRTDSSGLTIVGNTLMVTHDAHRNVKLNWAALDPPAYIVHMTGDKLTLPDATIASQTVFEMTTMQQSVDIEGVSTRANPFFYEVYWRDCDNATVVP